MDNQQWQSGQHPEGQPGQPPPQYGQPPERQPPEGQPGQLPPQYRQPPEGQPQWQPGQPPQYGQPGQPPLQYGQPPEGQPREGQPGQPPPQYGQPQWGQQPPPQYGQPLASQQQWQAGQPLPQQQWQQQPSQGYPGQPMYPYTVAQQTTVNVNVQQNQPGFFVRALYFIFIGWWVGWIWLNVGYFFVLTVIGIPLGLIMLNRLPAVLTLKPASQTVNINMTGNTTNINIGGAQQVNFLLRVLYFVFIGWWAGLIWSYIAYVMFVLIVTIPVGVLMLNILPAVITLRKN